MYKRTQLIEQFLAVFLFCFAALMSKPCLAADTQSVKNEFDENRVYGSSAINGISLRCMWPSEFRKADKRNFIHCELKNCSSRKIFLWQFTARPSDFRIEFCDQFSGECLLDVGPGRNDPDFSLFPPQAILIDDVDVSFAVQHLKPGNYLINIKAYATAGDMGGDIGLGVYRLPIKIK